MIAMWCSMCPRKLVTVSDQKFTSRKWIGEAVKLILLYQDCSMTRIHLLFYSLAKMYMFMQFAFDDINTFKHISNLPSVKLAIP